MSYSKLLHTSQQVLSYATIFEWDPRKETENRSKVALLRKAHSLVHVRAISIDMFPPSLHCFIIFWPLPKKILKQERKTEMVGKD